MQDKLILGGCAALLVVGACGTSGDGDTGGAASDSATGGITTAGTDSAGTDSASASDSNSDTLDSQSGTDGTTSDESASGSDTSASATDTMSDDSTSATMTEGSSSTGEQDCAAVDAEAELVPLPADIIFVVDNSGSMSFEAGEVQARMNDFSSQIIDSGVDAHVVLISSYPGDGNGICIDAPLGVGDCPDNDTNLPGFLHVDIRVGSNDAWDELLDSYDDWSSVIREESSKHIVIVSDDEPNLTDTEFDMAFVDLDPNYAGYFHHSVVSHSDCESAADIGQPYIDLSMATDGVAADLCDQDFQAVFDALTTAVLGGVAVACDFVIPEPPAGEVLDPDAVNVDIGSAMGPLETIPRVDDLEGCDAVADGWYYDDPDEPTMIFLCPQTCETMQALEDGVINIGFGCETILPG